MIGGVMASVTSALREGKRQKEKGKKKKALMTVWRMSLKIMQHIGLNSPFDFCLLPFTFPVRGVTSSVTAETRISDRRDDCDDFLESFKKNKSWSVRLLGKL